MRTKQLLTKTLLVVAVLLAGASSAWATDVPYNVGTVGTGDEWASRKYSDAYAIAPGETYHFTFTNTSYGSNNWNNWLLDCKATADTSVDDWYFTMRSDNYGWGTNYNATMKSCNFVWEDFKTVMNGATVDMYVNYNSTDKIIRTYATVTKDATEWYYNFASKAIDAAQVYLFLSEELAVLNITTAEKVAKLPDGEKNIYKRSVTDGYGYTWSIRDPITDSEDYNGWSVETSGTKTLDLTDGLKTAIGNSTGSLKNSITPTTGNIVKMDATFFLKGDAASTNVAYFRFGNIYIINDGVECQSRYLLNGDYSGSNTGTLFHSTSKGSTSIYRTTGITYRLQLELNTQTNKVTSMKVYVNGAAEPSLNISDQSLSSYEYSTIEYGYIKYGRSNGTTTCKLTDISVTETPQTITVVDYTIKFKDGLGNTLKEDVVHDNGVVGEVYQATAEDMETFYNDADVASATKKYVYKSGQNTETVASSTASENVITLVFDVYDKTTYHVNAQAGGSDIKTDIATGSAYLDGSTTAYWSKYLKVGEQWYVADAATYGAAITAATTNVAYTATDAINEFYEYETLSNSGTILDATTGTAVSGNDSKRLGANGKKWTPALSGGTYTVDLYCYGNNAKSVTLPMYYSDSDGSNVVYIGEATACTASAWGLKTTTNVVIPAGKSLCFYNNDPSNTHNYIVDYVTLKKTAEFASSSVTTTIGAKGWTTFAGSYALDLSMMTASEGTVTAYYASTVGGSSVTMTSTDATVEVGTGIMLKGTAGATITIPVAASGSSIDGNKLVGCTSATTITSGTSNYANFYVLVNGTTAAEFQNIQSYLEANAENKVTIPAGKAYLDATSASPAPSLNIVFEDGSETTGIDAIEHGTLNIEHYYDLQGRRVAQPTKGLYIVNGKKVVIK